MTFIQTLLETLLLEGKIDDINNQFPHIPNEVKSNILQRMPNPKSPDTNHYQWLLKQHSLGHLTDSHDIHDILSKFSKNKGTLKKPKLNQYSSINELHQAVNGLGAAPISKKQQAAKDTTILYSSPTMIVRQHHSHQSAIEAAKLPDSNQVKATVKSAEGEQIGKANWCVSADSAEGYTRYSHYTNDGTNPVYSIDTIHPDGSTRRHIYVTDNSRGNPEFRNEKQDDTQYDFKFKKFADENPEIMKTPIAHHFDQEKRKQTHLNDFLNGNIEHISSAYRYNESQDIINKHYEKINKVRNASTHEIDDLIKDKRWHIHLASNPNINQSHINELMKNNKTHYNLLNNKGMNIGTNNIQQIIDGNNISAKKTLIDYHFNDLHPSQYKPLIHSEWAEYIIKKHYLKKEHIDELIKNPKTHQQLLDRNDLDSNHIHELIKNPDTHKRLMNRHLDSSHIDELIKNPNNHKELTFRHDLAPHHIDEILKNSDDSFNHHMLALFSKNLTPHHIDELLKKPDMDKVLLLNKNLNDESKKYLNDKVTNDVKEFVKSNI